MNNQEILTKAIELAVANGFSLSALKDIPDIYMFWLEQGINYYQLIYSHDFAKALWGDDEVKLCEDIPDPETDPYGEYASYTALPNWQYNLQQMVIASDPIKYLGENLPNRLDGVTKLEDTLRPFGIDTKQLREVNPDEPR